MLNFIAIAVAKKLNPFLRDLYLIKAEGYPAKFVTGKDFFTKRAARNKLCSGYQAGVIIGRSGKIEEQVGSLVLKKDELLGGWAVVHRKDWAIPAKITVSLAEYVQKTREGNANKTWAGKPATMIRKVALVQALREAMPEEFGGLYSEEEMPPAGDFPEGLPKEPSLPKVEEKAKEDKKAPAKEKKTDKTPVKEPEKPSKPDGLEEIKAQFKEGYITLQVVSEPKETIAPSITDGKMVKKSWFYADAPLDQEQKLVVVIEDKTTAKGGDVIRVKGTPTAPKEGRKEHIINATQIEVA